MKTIASLLIIAWCFQLNAQEKYENTSWNFSINKIAEPIIENYSDGMLLTMTEASAESDIPKAKVVSIDIYPYYYQVKDRQTYVDSSLNSYININDSITSLDEVVEKNIPVEINGIKGIGVKYKIKSFSTIMNSISYAFGTRQSVYIITVATMGYDDFDECADLIKSFKFIGNIFTEAIEYKTITKKLASNDFYENKDKNFSINFPFDVKENEEMTATLLLDDSPTASYVSYVSPSGLDTYFQVYVYNLPRKQLTKEPSELIDDLKRNLLPGTKIVKDIEINGYKGFRAEYTGGMNGNFKYPKKMEYTQYVLSPIKLYKIVILDNYAILSEKDVESYINSFKFLDLNLLKSQQEKMNLLKDRMEERKSRQ